MRLCNLREVAVVHEMHCVAASGHHVRLFALSKATNFTRGGFKPEFAVFAQFELGIIQDCAGAWIDNGVGGPKDMGGHSVMVDGLWCRL
jgi:hypothetical protein